MTDFEDRLTSALRSAGDDAPDATGLAPAARRRAGVRRRRTALTSAAVVVAVAGVVGGVALLGNGDERTPQVTDDPTPSVTVASTPVLTERTESWRDLQVRVPASWGQGSLGDWCAGGGELGRPVVERPGASVDILCEPELGYGLRFSDGAAFDAAVPPGEIWQYTGGDVEMYPEGAWLGYQRTDDALAFVSAPTRDEVEAVLGSFVRITGIDANGCPAHGSDPMPEVGGIAVRLCRYGVDDWLEQSEVLDGMEAAHTVAALESAPAKGDRMCTMALTGPRVLVKTAEATGWVTLDSCHGFSWAGEEHDLTSDVLYWTLSPGWTGGVEGDVPMPSELRR